MRNCSCFADHWGVDPSNFRKDDRIMWLQTARSWRYPSNHGTKHFSPDSKQSFSKHSPSLNDSTQSTSPSFWNVRLWRG